MGATNSHHLLSRSVAASRDLSRRIGACRGRSRWGRITSMARETIAGDEAKFIVIINGERDAKRRRVGANRFLENNAVDFVGRGHASGVVHSPRRGRHVPARKNFR